MDRYGQVQYGQVQYGQVLYGQDWTQSTVCELTTKAQHHSVTLSVCVTARHSVCVCVCTAVTPGCITYILLL
jgi:hypothetical protein